MGPIGATMQQLGVELAALGLPPDLCTRILADARIGQCLLTRAGASPELTEMVADIHTPTWFAVGKTTVAPDTTVVHAIRGARQGCTLGAIIFNITYEFALSAVRNRAAEENLSY
eukprot:13647463-Heterocapsa_arctica.AAC.1